MKETQECKSCWTAPVRLLKPSAIVVALIMFAQLDGNGPTSRGTVIVSVRGMQGQKGSLCKHWQATSKCTGKLIVDVPSYTTSAIAAQCSSVAQQSLGSSR